MAAHCYEAMVYLQNDVVVVLPNPTPQKTRKPSGERLSQSSTVKGQGKPAQPGTPKEIHITAQGQAQHLPTLVRPPLCVGVR